LVFGFVRGFIGFADLIVHPLLRDLRRLLLVLDHVELAIGSDDFALLQQRLRHLAVRFHHRGRPLLGRQ
jgi:hypothetical protein